MRNSQATTRYYESSVNTASPERLVAMLYEGAVRSLKQSIAHIENGNLQGKRDAVDRTLAIVQELQTTLDTEKGAHIAVDLERLYSYITARIMDGSATVDVRPLQEAARLLTTLHSAWETVAAGGASLTNPLQAVKA